MGEHRWSECARENEQSIWSLECLSQVRNELHLRPNQKLYSSRQRVNRSFERNVEYGVHTPDGAHTLLDQYLEFRTRNSNVPTEYYPSLLSILPTYRYSASPINLPIILSSYTQSILSDNYIVDTPTPYRNAGTIYDTPYIQSTYTV